MLEDNAKALRIYSGNANPDLAREIAAYLGTSVGDAAINRFNNGEVQVMINESVRGKDIFIVQPTCGPIVNDNVMELLSWLMPLSVHLQSILRPLYLITVMLVRTVKLVVVNLLRPN